jgi:hypothetical protein
MMFRLLPAAKSTDGVSDLLTVAQILMPQTTTTNPVFDWIAPRFVALPVSGGFGAFYVAGMKSVLQGDIPWLDSEIPSADGVMTARALAKMHGAIANAVRIDGTQFLSTELVHGLTGEISRLLTPMVFDYAAIGVISALLQRGAAAARKHGAETVPDFGTPFVASPQSRLAATTTHRRRHEA